jgi:hypothetical protein
MEAAGATPEILPKSTLSMLAWTPLSPAAVEAVWVP